MPTTDKLTIQFGGKINTEISYVVYFETVLIFGETNTFHRCFQVLFVKKIPYSVLSQHCFEVVGGCVVSETSVNGHLLVV